MASPVDAPRSRTLSGDDRVRGLVLIGAMVALMWVLETIDVVGGNLDANGIHPRDVDTLPDIAFAPFLHAGWGHLIGNTVPFVVLGGAIALSGLARTAAVTAIVALVGGFGTWLIGPADTNHIGASGLVFGFAAYLIARGVFSRRALHLVAGVAVIAVYGATLLFGFIPHPGISWQGHVFGAVGGVVAARVLDRRRAPVAA
jgi:membrane associated rhomboid family serine protease